MPITDWRHYADHALDPIRRSSSGYYAAITDRSLAALVIRGLNASRAAWSLNNAFTVFCFCLTPLARLSGSDSRAILLGLASSPRFGVIASGLLAIRANRFSTRILVAICCRNAKRKKNTSQNYTSFHNQSSKDNDGLSLFNIGT
jgi:hypothetical protein